MKKTFGIIPFIYGVTEKEISNMIKRYRIDYSKDKRTDIELRPFAINEILLRRGKRYNKKER